MHLISCFSDRGRYLVKTTADVDFEGVDYDGAVDKRSDVGDSCLKLRKRCLATRACSRDLTAFRQSCKVRNGRCYADSR